MQNSHHLILTPLYSETKYLIQSLMQLGLEVTPHRVQNLNVFFIPQWQAWVTSAAKGKQPFADKAEFWLKNLPSQDNIKGIICVGSAGSLSPDVKPYDVVIAESILEHDAKLDGVENKIPEFFCRYDLIQKAKNLGWPKGSIHLGKMASGDEDIVDSLRAQQIAKLTAALAVAWEGAGVAKIAAQSHIDFLEIRAITDTADIKTYEDFKVNLKPAMQSLAQVLAELM